MSVLELFAEIVAVVVLFFLFIRVGKLFASGIQYIFASLQYKPWFVRWQMKRKRF